jgi:hypothetical protein
LGEHPELFSQQTNQRMPNKIDTHNLLREFAKTVEAFGVEETANLLSAHREQKKYLAYIDFIIQIVVNRFDLSFGYIVSKVKDEKRLLALKFIIYYCYKRDEIYVSRNAIGGRLNRGIRVVMSYQSEMHRKKTERKKGNEEIKEHFKFFDEKVKRYFEYHTEKSKPNEKANQVTTKRNRTKVEERT